MDELPILPRLRTFLRRHGLLYDTPTVPDPSCLIGWARDPADRQDGRQRAREYIRELHQTGRHQRDRAGIHLRLNAYIARAESLPKDMFRQCQGFPGIYELKGRRTRVFLCKWRCVWFLISGMDKNPNRRVAAEHMRQADRIRRDMEDWLDEHAPR